jgi:hypothetical protein
MSVIDLGNDRWFPDPCKTEEQQRFFRKCVSANSTYVPNEFQNNVNPMLGLDVFSVSMVFTEMLMA